MQLTTGCAVTNAGEHDVNQLSLLLYREIETIINWAGEIKGDYEEKKKSIKLLRGTSNLFQSLLTQRRGEKKCRSKTIYLF